MSLSPATITNESPFTSSFDEVFASLPPLPSSAYLTMLREAPAAALPAQVLVRAYRRLRALNEAEAAEATLARLLNNDDPHGYLRALHHLARKHVPAGQHWHDHDDLFQAALLEIIKTLPTARGALAENAWVRFCQNCFTDAWRTLHGRRGERLAVEFAEPTPDEETGELIFLVERTDGAAAPWHASGRTSELPKIEAILLRTIAQMADPLMRQVAADQFGPDPAPIAAGRSPGGKPPLTEQLGASRFQISRALRNAKARLAAALLTEKDLELDREWLRQFL